MDLLHVVFVVVVTNLLIEPLVHYVTKESSPQLEDRVKAVKATLFQQHRVLAHVPLALLEVELTKQPMPLVLYVMLVNSQITDQLAKIVL